MIKNIERDCMDVPERLIERIEEALNFRVKANHFQKAITSDNRLLTFFL